MREHVEVGPYAPEGIEKVYNGIMSSGYYDASYNAEDWRPEPYHKMAEIINSVFRFETAPQPVRGWRALVQSQPKLAFKPRNIIDLGCGVGFLVDALRSSGQNCCGIEFSPAIHARIAPHVKPFVQLLTGEEFFGAFSFADVDLVTALEVFEHLPISLLQKDLAKLRDECPSPVFLTIPSSGADPWSNRIGYIESSSYRLTDMRRNSVFSYLAMLDGTPGGGHITLASFRWWTEFFLINGFYRDLEFEEHLKKFNDVFASYRWCPYIIKSMRGHQVYLGKGWNKTGPYSANQSTQIMTLGGESELLLRVKRTSQLVMEFEIPDANRNLQPWVNISLEKLQYDPETGIIESKLINSNTLKLSETNRRITFSNLCDAGSSDFLTYRLNINTPKAPFLQGDFAGQEGGYLCSLIDLS